MKKTRQLPLILAAGTSLGSGFITTDVLAKTVETTVNPFVITALASGYMQLAAAKTESKDKQESKMKMGACGEGKCGGEMMKGSEEKTVEGRCAGNKPMPEADKDSEAKCGTNKTML